jgi:peptidoglycan/xylan/chitin deacetylase (PgdA/CDA1 family)
LRPIVPITIGVALAAVAAWFLPFRGLAWAGLGAAYLAVLVVGVVSMRSGVFGRAHTSGDRSRAAVALTYDDGPAEKSTGPLLDLLRERRVSAAFFVVGARARAHRELVKRCHAEGHLLANHSDRHSHLTNFLRARGLRRELEACQAALEEITGERPRYYRPPVGLMNPSVHPVARSLGLELVGWQVRSLDTVTSREPAEIARRVLARIRPGGIILLHDGGLEPRRVTEITERILDGLEERGLEPVRLDRLLT